VQLIEVPRPQLDVFLGMPESGQRRHPAAHFDTGGTLLATLGYPLFDPVANAAGPAGEAELFYCRRGGAERLAGLEDGARGDADRGEARGVKSWKVGGLRPAAAGESYISLAGRWRPSMLKQWHDNRFLSAKNGP
jgi:hypothetical protein